MHYVLIYILGERERERITTLGPVGKYCYTIYFTDKDTVVREVK